MSAITQTIYLDGDTRVAFGANVTKLGEARVLFDGGGIVVNVMLSVDQARRLRDALNYVVEPQSGKRLND